MTIDAQLAAYIPVTFLLAITPGATTAVVVRHALAGGRRAGYVAALGAAAGNASQAVAAGLGLAALLQQSPPASLALRIGGGAFLTWLGLQSVMKALARRQTAVASTPAGAAGSALRQGLLTNLLNPAIVTFYLVVVPRFVPAGAGARRVALLAAIHIVIAFACHVVWATAFDRLKAWFARPAVGRSLEAAAGVLLITLGIRALAGR